MREENSLQFTNHTDRTDKTTVVLVTEMSHKDRTCEQLTVSSQALSQHLGRDNRSATVPCFGIVRSRNSHILLIILSPNKTQDI